MLLGGKQILLGGWRLESGGGRREEATDGRDVRISQLITAAINKTVTNELIF